MTVPVLVGLVAVPVVLGLVTVPVLLGLITVPVAATDTSGIIVASAVTDPVCSANTVASAATLSVVV